MEEGGASRSTAAEGSSSGGEKIWCLERVGRDSGWLRLAENTEVTLGRGLDVTYQILSPKCPLMISRKHCLFRQNSEGHWTVVDKTSLNGVWVNGERIPPEKARTLSRGDSIQLGVAVDGMQVEFQYVLVQDFLQTLQPFLSDGLPKEQALESMPRKTKRKFSVEEASTPLDSQSKLYRCSTTDKSRGRSCPIAVPLQASPAAQDAAGPSRASLDAGRSHALTDCSSELACLQQHNQNMQAIRSRMLEVEQRAASLQAEGPDRPRETDELLQELSVLRSQLHCQQEAQVRRVKMLEKSFYEEEKRLEMEKKQEQEDSLKKQLETTLLEHRKLIEELRLSRQGFEEILQAKDKELEETKEEKEKARAQREEVVTQMTEVLENELQCIICSELFIEAVTLNCAHSFCQHCIREWRKRRDECPICRQAIASQTRSLVLDNCIDRMVEKLGAAMQQHRLALVREREGESN